MHGRLVCVLSNTTKEEAKGAIDAFYEKILNNLDIDYIGPEVTDDEGIAMFNRCIESVGNVGGMSLNEAMG